MSAPNHFEPPKAAVADVGPPRDATRTATAVLLGAMVLESLWAVGSTRLFFLLTDLGVLKPAGFACWLAGLLALYAGVARLLLAGRGTRLLAGAIVLLLLALFVWGASLVFFVGAEANFHGWPVLFALAIATGAWLIARAKGRARAASALGTVAP